MHIGAAPLTFHDLLLGFLVTREVSDLGTAIWREAPVFRLPTRFIEEFIISHALTSNIWVNTTLSGDRRA
jgi:hypothetical protein